jgi:hypothetical protein
MARIKLTIEGENVGTFEQAMNISDADAARILAAYGAIYGPLTFLSAEPGGLTETRPRTPEEIVALMADGTLRGILDNVQRHEADQASRAAAAAVTPIAATPA